MELRNLGDEINVMQEIQCHILLCDSIVQSMGEFHK